jgi:hypothetical protein
MPLRPFPQTLHFCVKTCRNVETRPHSWGLESSSCLAEPLGLFDLISLMSPRIAVNWLRQAVSRLAVPWLRRLVVWPCHGSLGYFPAPNCKVAPGQIISQYFSFPLSVSFRHCCIAICIYMLLLLPERQTGEAWEPSNKQRSFWSQAAQSKKVISFLKKDIASTM